MLSLWRTNEEITEIYRRQVKAVYRVCMLYFKGGTQDAEDAAQTTFLRLMKDKTRFCSEAHERAWLIVTAGNVCRDMLKSGWRRRVDMDEDALNRQIAPQTTDETLQAVMALPGPQKTALYMHYYEGYSTKEIAGYMGKNETTVRRYLRGGRESLKVSLKEGI